MSPGVIGGKEVKRGEDVHRHAVDKVADAEWIARHEQGRVLVQDSRRRSSMLRMIMIRLSAPISVIPAGHESARDFASCSFSDGQRFRLSIGAHGDGRHVVEIGHVGSSDSGCDRCTIDRSDQAS